MPKTKRTVQTKQINEPKARQFYVFGSFQREREG